MGLTLKNYLEFNFINLYFLFIFMKSKLFKNNNF